MVWAWDFHVGGLKFENSCQQKQGVSFWVELVRSDLPSADYCSVCELLHKSVVLACAHPRGDTSGLPLSSKIKMSCDKLKLKSCQKNT